jgi:outer membrane protein assembly factor BamB
MRGYFILAICLAAATIPGQAIFEEQADQYSWLQQHIGKPQKFLFAFKGRDRCFLSTEANAIASLDLRDGTIVWRQTLLPTESIDELALLPKPAAVVSLSDQGQSLRAWHASDGTFLWETVLSKSASSGKLPGSLPLPGRTSLRVLPDVTGDGSSDIAVQANGRLQASFFFVDYLNSIHQDVP